MHQAVRFFPNCWMHTVGGMNWKLQFGRRWQVTCVAEQRATVLCKTIKYAFHHNSDITKPWALCLLYLVSNTKPSGILRWARAAVPTFTWNCNALVSTLVFDCKSIIATSEDWRRRAHWVAHLLVESWKPLKNNCIDRSAVDQMPATRCCRRKHFLARMCAFIKMVTTVVWKVWRWHQIILTCSQT